MNDPIQQFLPMTWQAIRARWASRARQRASRAQQQFLRLPPAKPPPNPAPWCRRPLPTSTVSRALRRLVTRRRRLLAMVQYSNLRASLGRPVPCSVKRLVGRRISADLDAKMRDAILGLPWGTTEPLVPPKPLFLRSPMEG